MTFAAPPLVSGSELIDASLVFTKRYYGPIFRAAFPAIALALLVELALEVITPESMPLWEMLLYFMAWGLAEGLAVAACWDIMHGNAASRDHVWMLVAPRLAAIVIGYTLKWAFILVGLLLLILPGVYLIALYFAVPTASITEQASLRQAFRRSRTLARSELKRIMLTLGTFEVVVMILSFVITGVATGGISVAAGWVFGIVILPLEAALTTLLYLDIRMRKEAYDLQAALGPATP